MSCSASGESERASMSRRLKGNLSPPFSKSSTVRLLQQQALEWTNCAGRCVDTLLRFPWRLRLFELSVCISLIYFSTFPTSNLCYLFITMTAVFRPILKKLDCWVSEMFWVGCHNPKAPMGMQLNNGVSFAVYWNFNQVKDSNHYLKASDTMCYL